MIDKKVNEIEAITKDWVNNNNKGITLNYEITRSDRGIKIKLIDKVSGTPEQEFWENTFISELELEYLDEYLSHILWKLEDRIELINN